MYILFDIGGTKSRIAASTTLDMFNDPVVFDTPKLYSQGIVILKQKGLELSRGQTIHAIAGGIAGPCSRKECMLIASPNLPDWVGKPIKRELEETFHAPVYVENDAAMVGLGEAHSGAGRGFGVVVYITVSTGVGGARIVSGKIDERVVGFEPGHQIVDMDKTVVPEALGVDLESMIGGRWVEERTGKKPFEITDEAFWDKLARILAVGLNNTIVHWSPDVVILGGSMMNKIGVPLDKVEAHLRQVVKIYPELPALRRSELGDLGGLYGALAYLKQVSK
ncbi:ROK family protein [Patescibacteria group bacterium]|nr:MAG: ROK family protein [Patescibacteria group bacterium]